MVETCLLVMVKRGPQMYSTPFSKGYITVLKKLLIRSQKVTYPFSKGYILTNKVVYIQDVTPPLNKAYKLNIINKALYAREEISTKGKRR